MQLFINNWSGALTLPATDTAVQISVDPAAAALLVGLGGGDHYLLTISTVDGVGNENGWEIVRVTGNTGGLLDVVRGQEGTTALAFEAGTAISARLTRESLEALQVAGSSAWGGITGTLADQADLVAALNGKATSAQGVLADSAVQPGDLATVATSGAYNDLTGKPTLGTAAATASTDYATAAQGAKADTAVQPAALAEKEQVLTAGANVTIDRTDPDNPVISASVSGGGGGDVVGPASSTANEVALFDGITGKLLKGGGALGSAAAASTGDFAPAAHIGAGGTAHANVIAGGAAGFMSAADKTKLDSVASGANNYSHPNHTGDVTSTGDGATVIANGVVTNAKLANVSTATLKGRSTAGTGSPEDLTAAQARTLLNVANGATANDTDANLKNRANHTGSQLASTISDFAESVRSTVLTGLSLASSAAVAATDSVLEAFGKLQKQITDLTTTVSGKQATLVSGTNIKTVNGTTLLGSGDLVVSGGTSLAVVTTYAGTAKTLGLSDINTIVDCTSASAVTITIPPQASVAWTADAEIHVRMSAAGLVSIAVGAGVTVPPLTAPVALAGQGAMVTLKRRSSDVWAIVGGIAGGSSADTLNTTRIDVASASTVNLTSSAPNTRHINITGTTTITGFTVAVGQCYFVRFNAALTLTNNANIVTQTGANITTAAGDTCIIRATAANVVEVLCHANNLVHVSSEITGTAGGLVTVTHNLGVIPDTFVGEFTCTTASAGFSIGDKLYFPLTRGLTAGYACGAQVQEISSTIYKIRVGSYWDVYVFNKSTGAQETFSLANWTLKVTASRRAP